jgi:RHS repeat-associated protein
MVERNNAGSITQVLYLPGGGKIAVMSGQTLLSGYVPLPAGAVAQYSPNGGFYYRNPDWQGSARLVTQESTPWVSSDVAYSLFGFPYALSGSADYSYTGMNQDTSAALYDFPAREYEYQGRWVSPDPAGLAAVDPTNPQSWNRYAYVANNPLAYVDPSGMAQDCPAALRTGGICGWDGSTSSTVPPWLTLQFWDPNLPFTRYDMIETGVDGGWLFVNLLQGGGACYLAGSVLTGCGCEESEPWYNEAVQTSLPATHCVHQRSRDQSGQQRGFDSPHSLPRKLEDRAIDGSEETRTPPRHIQIRCAAEDG